MCVLTVQSDVGYATHVSTKPLPIWSSSRKDWSDWSMEPACAKKQTRANVSQDKLSGRGTNPTAKHAVVGASRDERTSDRGAHARWMHAIPTHARARDRTRAPKASSPTRQRWMMVSAMDDVEALDAHARQRYVPQPCPRRTSTRPRGKSTGDQCQLPAFVKFHPVSRGAEELARSIDRSIDRSIEVGSRRSRARVDVLASRDVARVEIDTEKQITRNTSTPFPSPSIVVVARVPQPRRECTCHPRTRSRSCHPAHRG